MWFSWCGIDVYSAGWHWQVALRSRVLYTC